MYLFNSCIEEKANINLKNFNMSLNLKLNIIRNITEVSTLRTKSYKLHRNAHALFKIHLIFSVCCLSNVSCVLFLIKSSTTKAIILQKTL